MIENAEIYKEKLTNLQTDIGESHLGFRECMDSTIRFLGKSEPYLNRMEITCTQYWVDKLIQQLKDIQYELDDIRAELSDEINRSI